MGKRKNQTVMEGDTLSDSESGDLDSVSVEKIFYRLRIFIEILLIDIFRLVHNI